MAYKRQASEEQIGVEYSEESGYDKHSVVYHNGSLYVCGSSIPSPAGQWDGSKWGFLGNVSSAVGYLHARDEDRLISTAAAETFSGISYEIGDIISYEGYLYKCISPTTHGEPFKEEQWEVIHLKDIFLEKSKFSSLNEETSTMADIIRALKGTAVAAIAAVGIAFGAFGDVAVQKAKLKDIRGGEYVVTNVIGAISTEEDPLSLHTVGGTMTGGIAFMGPRGECGISWGSNLILEAARRVGIGARGSFYFTDNYGSGSATSSLTPDGSEIITANWLSNIGTVDVPTLATQILTQSGRDCGGKIADATNAVTKVLTISTNGVAAARYNGTAEVSLDITAGGGGVDPEQVKTIISEVFPSNRVFGVDGGLLSAYDVSADGARTNEIWREARGYALTNGVEDAQSWKTRGLDGTITTITIGDETMAAAGVSVDLPSAWDAEARDFSVYVFNGTTNAAPLRLPTNVSIYGYYASATNALKKNAVTALYFTEISRNTFLLGRAELTKVQEAAQ